MIVSFVLNGQPVSFELEAETTLLDAIRSSGLTGTKEGCSVGVCGACTVAIEGHPVSSCIYFAALAEGREVLTVEGVAERAPDLIETFVEHEGMQCGICTPGQVVSAYTLKLEQPEASVPEIRAYLSGNLCRCTGYASITDAAAAYLGDG